MELSLGCLVHLVWTEVPLQLIYIHLRWSEHVLRLVVIHVDVRSLFDLEGWQRLRLRLWPLFLGFCLEAWNMGFRRRDIVLVLALFGRTNQRCFELLGSGVIGRARGGVFHWRGLGLILFGTSPRNERGGFTETVCLASC